jgi:hypothetical protein
MKSILVALFCLFSFSAIAMPWQEIEVDTDVILKQEIFFEKEGFKIPKNTKFIVEDFMGLPQINVSLIKLILPKCKFSNLSTEMILATDEGGEAVVGLQLQKDCLLEVFVENQDLNKSSLFELGK